MVAAAVAAKEAATAQAAREVAGVKTAARRAQDWNADYTSALRDLHGCVWNAYASLDDAAAAAALEHRLCVPHPLSTKLYSLLLLTTFGDDGMPLSTTQSVVQLLSRVRRRFGLSVPCHMVCLAEATYAMHRRLPDNVDLAAALLRRVEHLPPPSALPPPPPPTAAAAAGSSASSSDWLLSGGSLGTLSPAAIEAMAHEESSRGMRDHFARTLGDLHASMPTATSALLQHVLDVYVHLYSQYIQPPQPPLASPQAAVDGAGAAATSGAPIRPAPPMVAGVMGGAMAPPMTASVSGESFSDGLPLSSLVAQRILQGEGSAGGCSAAALSAQLSLPDLGGHGAPPNVAPSAASTSMTPTVAPTSEPLRPHAPSDASHPAEGGPSARSSVASLRPLLLPEPLVAASLGKEGGALATDGAALGAMDDGAAGALEEDAESLAAAHAPPRPPPSESNATTFDAPPEAAPPDAQAGAPGAGATPAPLASGAAAAASGADDAVRAYAPAPDAMSPPPTDPSIAAASSTAASAAPTVRGAAPPAAALAPAAAVVSDGVAGEAVAEATPPPPPPPRESGYDSAAAAPGEAPATAEGAPASGATAEVAAPAPEPGMAGGGEGGGEGGGVDVGDDGAAAGGEEGPAAAPAADTAADAAADAGGAAEAEADAAAAGSSYGSSSLWAWVSPWWKGSRSRSGSIQADAKDGARAAADGGAADGGAADGGSNAAAPPPAASDAGGSGAGAPGGNSGATPPPTMMLGLPPHLLKPLPLWAGPLEATSHARASLGGPAPPVLEEVRRLYKSSIRRCWVDLCGRAYSGKAGSLGSAVASSAPPDEAAADDGGGGGVAVSRKDSGFGLGGDGAKEGATLDIDQLLVLAQSMAQKLELEAVRFHPVFAQYAPSIAEFAAEEWGHLFVNEQLTPALRAHCAAAKLPAARVAALAHFLPLWRVMSRMNSKHGPLWHAAQLEPALSHVAPSSRRGWATSSVPPTPRSPTCTRWTPMRRGGRRRPPRARGTRRRSTSSSTRSARRHRGSSA